jgi:hypothetical protein
LKAFTESVHRVRVRSGLTGKRPQPFQPFQLGSGRHDRHAASSTGPTCERPTAFIAWRKQTKGRWKALGTFPTEVEAWQALKRAMKTSEPGDYSSLILPAGQTPWHSRRIKEFKHGSAAMA